MTEMHYEAGLQIKLLKILQFGRIFTGEILIYYKSVVEYAYFLANDQTWLA